MCLSASGDLDRSANELAVKFHECFEEDTSDATSQRDISDIRIALDGIREEFRLVYKDIDERDEELSAECTFESDDDADSIDRSEQMRNKFDYVERLAEQTQEAFERRAIRIVAEWKHFREQLAGALPALENRVATALLDLRSRLSQIEAAVPKKVENKVNTAETETRTTAVAAAQFGALGPF